MASESDRKPVHHEGATAGNDARDQGGEAPQGPGDNQLTWHFSEREIERLEELADRENLNSQ